MGRLFALRKGKDSDNNIPLEEEQFGKVEDERVSLRRNFRKVYRPQGAVQ